MKMLVVGTVVSLLASIGMAQNASQPSTNDAGPTLSHDEELITTQDVIAMLKAGLSPDVTAAKIRTSKCQCDTSPAALLDLKAAGVPDNVILAIAQSTAPPARKAVITDILDAKTVYLLNMTTDFKVFKHLRERLQKWGRWTIVQRREDADLLLVFSGSQSYIAAVNTMSFTGTGSYASGFGTSIPLTSNQRFLIAVDRASESQLDAVSCERRLGADYTAGVLVNRMKKQIEKPEKKSTQ